jgi:hypothetical protein
MKVSHYTPLVMEPCELGGLNMTYKQTPLIPLSVVCAVGSSVNTTFMLCCSKCEPDFDNRTQL